MRDCLGSVSSSGAKCLLGIFYSGLMICVCVFNLQIRARGLNYRQPSDLSEAAIANVDWYYFSIIFVLSSILFASSA